jgi:Pyridoxamine 5'-phosphate oxidase/SnoaL-like domain
VNPFGAAMLAADMTAAAGLLHPDATFNSPAVFQPYRGRDAVLRVLTAATQTFEDFAYTGETQGPGVAVLRFRARVGRYQLEGVDIVTTGNDGLITDVTVMVRPLRGLEALVAAMQQALARQPDGMPAEKAAVTSPPGDRPVRPQKRARAIAMSPEEVDAYLRVQRTCRVATAGADGSPHVAPLWYVWDGSRLWLNSLVRSQRWTNLVRNSRISVVVDGGTEFHELHGVELSGRASVVGEAPRGTEPNDELTEPERLFAAKYMGGGPYIADGRHGWLRVDIDKLVSWDFRKNPALRSLSRPAGS